ncbi:hypothetical protein [Truepera radiovictrix]|uniref:hypothetical protein n=1 Tax=Truepera radiovictrix TaxID=332249 RepID=UPI00031253F3|nr:hypothetical protein [Truepera radiovictrix]WMT57122.1 hypothetical protein RCV51_14020 [Truepera radiovictrix]
MSEFKDKATTLIAEEKALVIEERGRAIGLYIPLARKDGAKSREETERLERVIADMLGHTGMTREAFEAAREEAGKADSV